MMGEVFQFKPEFVGEGYRFDAAEILDAAKKRNLSTMVVMGQTEDGEIYVAGTANRGESLVLIERAKRIIVFGDTDG
jgi:aspartate 1-decarboxylase